VRLEPNDAAISILLGVTGAGQLRRVRCRCERRKKDLNRKKPDHEFALWSGFSFCPYFSWFTAPAKRL